MAEISFSGQAQKDLLKIKDYYLEVSDTVCDNFFKEFFLTLSYIEQNPLLFQVRYREVRIAPLYKYPYGIHYRIRAKDVAIYRVLHFKQYFK